MIATSLRARVFLLVAAILALVAAFVMLVTQRAVTQTVYGAEERATSNMLRLVALDVDARFRQLLREKITTVRGYRSELDAYGETVQGTLHTLARAAQAGSLSQENAQALALEWLDTVNASSNLDIFVYDDSQRILNRRNQAGHGGDLAKLRDIKGRALATDIYSDADGSLFGVYHWPDPATGERKTHFGHFRLFTPWNWVVVVSNVADAVEESIARQRNEIVLATSTTLSQLQLSRSGFAFVFAGDGHLVVPPPAQASYLLDQTDIASHATLLETLRGADTQQHDAPLRFATGHNTDQTWELNVAYVKPLDWYVATVVPRSDLLAPAHRLLRQQGAIFMGMLGVALLLAWFYASRLIRPLNLLTDYARELPTRDLTEQHPVPPAVARLPQQHQNEVGRLATTILYMEEQLVENVRRLMDETSEREKIESELSIARQIQLGLLPLPLDQQTLGKLDLYATMIAAKEVGGDLYDYFIMDDGRICLAIGDVSGKGVPAALFMAITRTLIRTAARQATSAGAIMEAINDRLSEQNPNMMFVTLFIGLLDTASGELQYANAGHPPPWLLRQGQVELLPGRSGPACGVVEGVPYREFTRELPPGTTLIGYTDGVTEATNVDDVLYGDPRAIDVLEQQAPDIGCEPIATALYNDIVAFAGAAEQADDITMILLCRYDSTRPA